MEIARKKMTMRDKIKFIITNYFDWRFFWLDPTEKQEKIKIQSNLFISQNPDGEKKFIELFKSNFPEYKISKVSYFIDEDRCLCYEVIIDQTKYFCCISIFNYFLFYEFSNSSKKHINPGENKIVDQIYFNSVSKSFKDIEWITNEELIEPIEQFNSEYNQDPCDELDNPIYVGDLLSRFH
ncbi:hypothetical protein ACP6L2_00980 [Sphingobacterium lactis]|uniref:hypothetical protein n=1 Tax=Sphingobacterium lactis TaxID=797291 RepID=UPI003F7E5880